MESEFIQNISLMYNKTNLRTMFHEKLSLPVAMDVIHKPDFWKEYYHKRIEDMENYFHPKPSEFSES